MLVLPLAACGDDSSGDTGTTTTTAAPAVTTTSGATTTTGDAAVAARVAAAQELAGDYTGEWHNLTFGSTGSIEAGLVVDEAAATAALTLDLGGNVFGATDPDAFTVEFDLTSDGPYAGSNDIFGDFTVAVTDGHVTLTAPDVPGLNLEVIIEADIVDGVVTGTYDIPGLANGEFTAARA